MARRRNRSIRRKGNLFFPHQATPFSEDTHSAPLEPPPEVLQDHGNPKEQAPKHRLPRGSPASGLVAHPVARLTPEPATIVLVQLTQTRGIMEESRAKEAAASPSSLPLLIGADEGDVYRHLGLRLLGAEGVGLRELSRPVNSLRRPPFLPFLTTGIKARMRCSCRERHPALK